MTAFAGPSWFAQCGKCHTQWKFTQDWDEIRGMMRCTLCGCKSCTLGTTKRVWRTAKPRNITYRDGTSPLD